MSSDEFFSQYNKVTENVDRYHVPGVSIAVVNGDSTYSKVGGLLPIFSHSKGIKGYRIAKYPDKKVKPDTIFNAASMTKDFVASAVSLLVDDEKLPDVQWTTPVSKMLPDDFVLSDPRYTEKVTLQDILSHRSGLPE